MCDCSSDVCSSDIWKVGKIDPPIDGANRLAGPIFMRHIVAQADSPVPMPVFSDGFAAAEAEFLLRVGTPPPADQKRFTTEKATAHIDMVDRKSTRLNSSH